MVAVLFCVIAGGHSYGKWKGPWKQWGVVIYGYFLGWGLQLHQPVGSGESATCARVISPFTLFLAVCPLTFSNCTPFLKLNGAVKLGKGNQFSLALMFLYVPSRHKSLLRRPGPLSSIFQSFFVVPELGLTPQFPCLLLYPFFYQPESVSSDSWLSTHFLFNVCFFPDPSSLIQFLFLPNALVALPFLLTAHSLSWLQVLRAFPYRLLFH